MGFLSKDEAPKGPDFNKLLKVSEKYTKKNDKLFKEAMAFGKDNFSKGEEWVQRLTDFGMDAMGRLNTQADAFGKDVAGRVAGLDAQGAKWGKAADDIYAENKKLAGDVTGKLMPGMGTEAELGTKLLGDYSDRGIAEQDKYMAKLGGWDTTGRREERAGAAINDVAMASEAARESELRRLESFGIDPSQTRSAALDSRIQAANAIAKAQAANTARQAVEEEGIGYGKVASDMWNERAGMGFGAIESAGNTGRTIAEIARQPGADYNANLAALGNFGVGVGQLEQAGGRAGFDMRSTAAGFGERGAQAGATQQNEVNRYGSSVYDQGRGFIGQSADIMQGGYQGAGQLNANDIARVEQNNKNSFGGQLGELAGIAAPFVMDWAMPGSGKAFKAATGIGAREGREITREDSPSFGIVPDDVHVRATPGEIIMDPETVAWFGKKHFRNLQAQARKGLGIPETAGE